MYEATLFTEQKLIANISVLAEKVFKRAQYPTATPTGQAFPVGRVR